MEHAIHYANVPFERIVEALAPPRRLGTAPVFQVKLNVRQSLGLTGALPDGLEVEAMEVPERQAQLDLVLNLAQRPGGALSLELEYRRDLFDESDAEQLLAETEAALEAVRQPDQRLGALRHRLARLHQQRAAAAADRFGASAGQRLRRRLASRSAEGSGIS